MSASRRPSFLRVVFLNNGYWKLFSLCLSVVIYFSIRADISHMRTITVPVETEYDSVAGGAAIESVEPRSVQVTVRGSYSDVNQLALSAVRCVVRPRQKKTTPQDVVAVKLGASSVRGLRQLRVTKVEPNVAVVKFDVPMTLRLAIARPELLGRARGRVELVYDPTHALVKGSRRLLSPLDPQTVQVQLAPIDVDGRSESFTAPVRLLPPGGAENATVDPAEVVVTVRIISEKATARLERVPVTVLQPFGSERRWAADPACVDIVLGGRSEVVQGVVFGDVTASVNGNVAVAPDATNAVPVLLHVRQGLVLDEVAAVPAGVRLVPRAAAPAEGAAAP